jgi:hypothetical protein
MAEIDRPTPNSDDLAVNVDVSGCSIEPHFFAYRLDGMRGQFRYHHHRLEVTQAKANHGKSILALEQGAIDLNPKGGHHAVLQVSARDLHIDEELCQALPGKKLQQAARALKLQGPVQVDLKKLVVQQAAATSGPPVIYWDGLLYLQDAHLSPCVDMKNVTGVLACVGRHNGQQLEGLQGKVLLDRVTAFHQPFTNVVASIEVPKNAPDVLHIGLRAPLFSGDVTGECRVNLHSTPSYALNLTASQIDLQQFGQHNLGKSTQLQGVGVGRLVLTGEASGLDSLEGEGKISVPVGKLGKDLPLLLDFIKFLGLHWPDGTAFEEAHAQFGIHGKRVSLKRLELLGNAVSLTGKGEFNLDGSDVQVDVYPTWARLVQWVPPMMRPLPVAVSKNLLTIEVRGKVGGGPDSLRFNKKLVPIVLEPLTVLRDRVIGAPEKKQ